MNSRDLHLKFNVTIPDVSPNFSLDLQRILNQKPKEYNITSSSNIVTPTLIDFKKKQSHHTPPEDPKPDCSQM